MAQLFVLSGADVGRSFDLKEGARIGRSPECEIVLRDPSVSRKHAHAERRGEAWWIVDDGSRNGLTVERVRVPRLELHDGQEFLVGELLVRFRAGAAQVPASPQAAPPAARTAPAPPKAIAEVVLEGEDAEIEIAPRELAGTKVARQPRAAAPAPGGALRDTGFGPRAAGTPMDARKTAAGARILQYHRIEDRAGLASADLAQLPAWSKLALFALGVALAGAIAYLAFAGTATLKERVAPETDAADGSEDASR